MFSPNIWFAVALAFLSALVFFPAKAAMQGHQPPHPQANEPHHFWLGLGMFVVGLALGSAHYGTVGMWLGAAVMADDALLQHFAHWMACLYWESGVPASGWQRHAWLAQSPLHRLAGAVGLYRAVGLDGKP